MFFTRSLKRSQIRIQMANSRIVRDALLFAHADKVIKEEEFLLLFDINQPGTPEFPYWKYNAFDLDALDETECEAEFRFLKSDIYTLSRTFNLPDDVRLYNGAIVNSTEALCILLKRFAYPCRFGDMVPRFARPTPQLSMITNHMVDLIFNQYSHLLTDLNQQWLSAPQLQNYADAVYNKGGALDNCWGFVDGTVRPICRPRQNQREVYNGHKRVHAIKFQSVVTPNGLIANLYGPVEGRCHDSRILGMSGLLQQLQQYSHSPAGAPLCIYGDTAYPHRVYLQAPFRGPQLAANKEAFNTSMSKVRIAVEWLFGDIINYFKFLDFKKNLKIGLSAVGKMYIVCALLRNAHTCLYKSNTSDFFEIDPPRLDEYFI